MWFRKSPTVGAANIRKLHCFVMTPGDMVISSEAAGAFINPINGFDEESRKRALETAPVFICRLLPSVILAWIDVAPRL